METRGAVVTGASQGIVHIAQALAAHDIDLVAVAEGAPAGWRSA